MKILVTGSGGREHALAWKLAQSPKVDRVYCAPGNAGIARDAECVPIKAEDIQGLADFAERNGVDLTVVGPEAPLVEGIVDLFEERGLRVFGPCKAAARLEGSKAFAKSIMERYGVPTARGEAFTDAKKARAYIKEVGAPVVVKADGLAAGKGVLVCSDEDEALDAVDRILVKKEFGAAGDTLIVEECLAGQEASFIAFVDGKTVLPLPSSQDHKAIYDGDKGPNTGGMGAYSPAPVVTPVMHRRIMETVMIPMVEGMAAEGAPFKGMLYAGLMISGDTAKVLEFNVRFGDPECQPLVMRLKSDLVEILEAAVDGRLDEKSLGVDDRACVCVVMASQGYPGSYEKGKPISGLDKVARAKDVMVFHAGTAEDKGKTVTSGGRVLGVCALGDTVKKATDRAYKAVGKIHWEGAYNRMDIAKKALGEETNPPRVLVVMGSDSDMPVMSECARVLKDFGISYEMTVCSAHRTPDRAARLAREARERGTKVIVCGAGAAAHLAGAFAAHSTLPIIGVPIDATPLDGMDALLATVQMPPGVPVATVAVGRMGAKNAGYLAAQILGCYDPEMERKLAEHKTDMAESVARKAEKLTERG
ncbi:MAG: phosphoribosylamine--glycine ligase [Desulfatibacillaceae bacterium]